MATWKSYARIILAHVSLIVLSVVYVGFGAFLFYQLEQPNEVEVRARNIERFNVHKRQMIDHLWEMRSSGIGQRRSFIKIVFGKILIFMTSKKVSISKCLCFIIYVKINFHFPDVVEDMAVKYVDNVTRILFEAFDTHCIGAKHLRPGGENEDVSFLLLVLNYEMFLF